MFVVQIRKIKCPRKLVRISNGNRTEWSPIRSVIIRVITKSDDRAAGVRFVYHEYDYRPNWTTWSQLPINHKNYNFREKKNSQVMWQRENLHSKIDKACINLGVCTLLLWWLKLRLWLVDLNYNFECDWFVELPDNKLSDNNLASELVGNRSFLNRSQLRKL